VRIITGKYRGRVLSTVPDRSVRPATDRVRSTIFNVLQNRLRMADARVLDAFAGSGSLGFEALSRGASHVTFVDNQPKVLRVIESNARMLGCEDSCDVIESDALAFIANARRKFDLIFADPPYLYGETSGIPRSVFERELLARGGFLIIEHSRKARFEPSGLYESVVEKEFGGTRVSFFSYPSQGGESS